jgi:serine/threonine-protein phosphatase 6 regulatory ankyrin repeat subunit B
VVALLLKKGAEVDTRNSEGHMSYAMSRYLEDSRQEAGFSGKKNEALEKISLGGYTPLAGAAVRGHEEVMEMLIAAGARIDSRCNRGETPLAIAAQRGHLGVVEMLLDKGADINHEDLDGNTPLIYAVNSGRKKVVQMLIQHEADPEHKNRHGHSAHTLAKDDAVFRMFEEVVALQ